MKDGLIKARVPKSLKDKIEDIASQRGEAEAVIIRDALNEYVIREEATDIQQARAAKSVSYITRTARRVRTKKKP